MGSRGIWTFMSARTRRSLTLTWTALFVLSLLLQYIDFAAAPPARGAQRGHLRARRQRHRPGAPGADWENGPEGARSTPSSSARHRGGGQRRHLLHDGRLEGRERHPRLGDHRQPGPGQGRAARRLRGGLPGRRRHVGLLRADRFDNDGTAQIGFWFFQDDIGIASGDFTGDHVDGDVLIISEYTNGGVVSSICAYAWDGDGGGSNIDAAVRHLRHGHDGSNLNLVAAGAGCDVADGTFDICAKTNEDIEDAPWPFLNKDGETDFGPGQFFEGGINLSDMFGGDAPVSARSSPRRARRPRPTPSSRTSRSATSTPASRPTSRPRRRSDRRLWPDRHRHRQPERLARPRHGTVDFFICAPAQITRRRLPRGRHRSSPTTPRSTRASPSRPVTRSA